MPNASTVQGKTAIAVLGDRQIYRRALAQLLHARGMRVLVEARSAQAGTLGRARRLDAVVAEFSSVDPRALPTVRLLRGSAAPLRTIVLVDEDRAGFRDQALKLGVSSVLDGAANVDDLIAAIRALPPETDASARSAIALPELENPTESVRTLLPALSNREREVMAALARGGTNRVVAKELFISEATVKRHLANIFVKLGASSRLDAVRKAVTLGLVAG